MTYQTMSFANLDSSGNGSFASSLLMHCLVPSKTSQMLSIYARQARRLFKYLFEGIMNVCAITRLATVYFAFLVIPTWAIFPIGVQN